MNWEQVEGNWRQLGSPRQEWRVVMNWEQVEGNWKQLKGRVQKQWGKLTDDDVDVINGKGLELVGKVQERYGCAREEAEEEVRKFCDTCK